MPAYNVFSELCLSLGHPARLAILDAIVEQNNCVEKQVLEIPSVSKNAFAGHIRAMKRAGLIKGKLVKNKYCYCVDWNKLETLRFLFEDLYNRAMLYKDQVELNSGKCTRN